MISVHEEKLVLNWLQTSTTQFLDIPEQDYAAAHKAMDAQKIELEPGWPPRVKRHFLVRRWEAFNDRAIAYDAERKEIVFDKALLFKQEYERIRVALEKTLDDLFLSRYP